jgi:hypothetical protein
MHKNLPLDTTAASSCQCLAVTATVRPTLLQPLSLPLAKDCFEEGDAVTDN